MYKNKERKINYPHQKTVVTSTIVRTQNFNNSELLRVNHSIIDSKSSRSNSNNSIHVINHRANNNIQQILNSNSINHSHNNSGNNQNLNRNNILKSKNSKEIKQGTQPSSEERRLEQRQKQIEYGKNTIGYKIYTKVIKKEKRKKTDPWTPDKYTKCSKRCWDGMVRSWRRQLHNWDPVSDDTMKMNIDQTNDTLTMTTFNTNDNSITNNINITTTTINSNNNINSNNDNDNTNTSNATTIKTIIP
ncbi:hypothetical protein BCR36DRAFT_410203 [Piromyces finnis]|uniref:Histone RNA hairpin-binding protein RNA-binding domain-containing protein n=1 Tax=Piromyces finnis TaxID=1754191 RepID=A0A1Y1VHL2_9FUNG|nr:hypothetical protein BCR36DRAFT_410203 [Piromyces finnis]|eukprot:ORX55261.1 hypothetical protein BCR36DRAFT_410203 [Piromyces finnis]